MSESSCPFTGRKRKESGDEGRENVADSHTGIGYQLQKFLRQLSGKNPFEGDIVPSRVRLFQGGRPTLPFPHPLNYRKPLRILDSIFCGVKGESKSGRHNRYLSVPGLPYVLVTRDPELIRAILLDTGDKPGQFDRDPSPADGIARATGVDSLLYSNGDRWRRQKKLAAPPFGRTTLFQPERFHDFEVTFRKTVADRLERLRDLQQRSGNRITRIPLEPEIQAVMLEMLVNNFFGATLSYEEIRNRYVPAIARLINHMVSDTVIPRSRNLLRNFGEPRARLLRDKQDFEHLTDLALAGRKEGRGLWGHFKSEATDAQLRSNIRVFLAGALEATTSLAAWTLSHLSRAPQLQDLIHEEVKGMNQYDPEKLREARTLGDAITETLRLTPSLYFLPRRATVDRWVSASEDLRIMIPRGTHVVLAVWHANRCEEFWGRKITGYRASQFAPDRWKELERRGMSPSDLPHFGFGHGPRTCPGKYLGMLEVTLVVGAITKLFRFTAVNKSQKALAGVSTKPLDGVLVDLELR